MSDDKIVTLGKPRLAGKAPRLITSNGDPLSRPVPPEVTMLPPKPITDKEKDATKHWVCAVDMLKELINDIEHGRINPPEFIYVAMRTRHPENKTFVAHPSYCWTPDEFKPVSRFLMKGLLAHHEESI